MEDFTTIFWVILVGAAALFCAVKSNASKRRGAEKKFGHTEEVDQRQEQIPPPLPSNAPGNRVATSYTATKPTIFNPETENIVEQTEANERIAGQQEEFDLRKAVIYSEILRPKFEE